MVSEWHGRRKSEKELALVPKSSPGDLPWFSDTKICGACAATSGHRSDTATSQFVLTRYSIFVYKSKDSRCSVAERVHWICPQDGEDWRYSDHFCDQFVNADYLVNNGDANSNHIAADVSSP